VARPRVLFVSHNHPSVRPGGAEVYALELYAGIRDSGLFEPVLLARAGPPVSSLDRPLNGSRLSTVDSDPNQYFFHTDGADYDWLLGTSRDKSIYLRDLHEFLLAAKPDVVHFQHTLFLGYDIVRQTRNTLPGVPIVYTLHEYLPICHRDGQMIRTMDNEPCLEESPSRCHECFPDIAPQSFFLRKRFIQSQLALVDVFLAPSRFLLEQYVRWGIPREKIQFEDYGRPRPARHGSDAPVPPERLRNRFGFFGQLNPFKGLDVLLRAMEIIQTGSRPAQDGDNGISQQESWPRLQIHGANLELQRGTFQNEIRALLQATTDTVTLVGRYDPREIETLMGRVDWVVVPSIWWENSPLVIQEAFLYRRPVICSDIGGMAEKVTHGVNGLHFRTGDPKSLAETILVAAGDPGLWARLSRNVPQVYPIEDHVASLVALYEELLVRKSPAAQMEASHAG
jgi:glycosyltransferase involved in cell wall biosynthesis